MIRLLDIVLQSSAIVTIGLLVLPLLRARSAALRHWVLATVLVCAASVPLVGRLMPAWSTPIDLSFATGLLSAPSPLPFPDAGTFDSGTASLAAVALPARAGDVPPVGSLLIALWLGGTALWLTTLSAGLVRLARLSRTARPAATGPWVDGVARVAARLGITRPVTVRVLDHPALLLVWGLQRPTLLVPRRAEAWPIERIAAVVQHELAHIRRGDWITQVMSETIRALYWFNPLVWIACARMRAESEMAADDTVLAQGTGGTTYAAHLVEIARDLNRRSWLPAPAIVRRSTLERRITAMLDASRDRRPLSTTARGAAGALILTVTVAIAGLAAQTFSSIAGTIVDPSQGVLPGVTLVLTNEQTQAKYEIKTDRTGRYEFVGLPPGTYLLSAALPGFAQFNGRVTVGGQPLQQDVMMSIGTVQETVTVVDGPAAPPSPPNPERARQIEELRLKRAASTCAETQPGGDVRMGGNIRVPVKLRDFRPRFPEAVQGTSGVVVLSTQIGLDGSVEDIDVVSSTDAAFTDAAIDAVRQWEFDATLLNCERVVTPMRVTVNFKAQ